MVLLVHRRRPGVRSLHMGQSRRRALDNALPLPLSGRVAPKRASLRAECSAGGLSGPGNAEAELRIVRRVAS